MADLATLITALDGAHRELGEALAGLPADDAWRRPIPTLPSVGEIVAHIAYWEGRSFLGRDFGGPLADEAAGDYPLENDGPFRLDLDPAALAAELARVHDAAKSALSDVDPSADNPHRPGWTWAYTLEYQAFHIAYHTGQIYTVRHLLGHETVDN